VSRGAGRLLRLGVSLAGLAVLIFFVADPDRLLRELRAMAPAALALAVALAAADRILMAYKWWLLVDAADRLSLTTAIKLYFAASFAGLFLPVTVGPDALRIVAARDVGLAHVTASVIVERLLGSIAVAVVAAVSCLLLLSAVRTDIVISLVTPAVVLGLLGLAALVASLQLVDRWPADSRWRQGRLGKAIDAYARYRHRPRLLARFLSLSIVESLIPAFMYYVVAWGLGFSTPLQVFVATTPLALVIARLPVSLGGFGVQEAAFVYLAGLLDVPRTTALSIALASDVALIVALLPGAFALPARQAP
jgi:uncharacterized membrane protein YbhN (UPF0104 family)